MLNRLYSWYGKRVVWSVGGIVILLIIAGITLSFFTKSNPTENQQAQEHTVHVSRVSDLSDGATIDLIGTVEAVNEARLQSEASGRLTKVSVSLGDHVNAGQTIATIENASEYASLLQAEGAYDAAVAAAASSDVGVSGAADSAVTTYKSTYATVNGIFINTIDQLYSNTNYQTPGLKIDGGSYTTFLNNERYAFNDILRNFRLNAASISTNDDLTAKLDDARVIAIRTEAIVEAFLTQLPKQSAGGVYSQSELSTLQSEFATARVTLNSAIASIDSAKENLAQASIRGSGSVLSSADANVKQALGVLRAAQANYAKTIVKTPIGGTVNVLPVKTSDYVSIGTPIATVANNNALLITAYLNKDDSAFVAVGDTVAVDDGATGTISNIAPAIDPATGKVQVKIAIDTLSGVTNGDTVALHFSLKEPSSQQTSELRVPITAFKITPDGPVAFTVGENGALVSHPVVLGAIQNNLVVVKSGLTPEMVIVTDARGLKDGQMVTVTK